MARFLSCCNAKNSFLGIVKLSRTSLDFFTLAVSGADAFGCLATGFFTAFVTTLVLGLAASLVIGLVAGFACVFKTTLAVVFFDVRLVVIITQ